MTTDEHLAAIPLEYRTAVARWLIARSDTFRPSWVASPAVVNAARSALVGAAVDIVTLESDDTTIDHAIAVLDELASVQDN